MKAFSVTRLALVGILAFGLILGASVVSAATESFKIKENKIFFNIMNDNENVQEEFTLPTVVGRTGHVYIFKLAPFFPSGIGAAINASPGETIEGSMLSIGLSGSTKSHILVADEVNNTWWVLASVGY